MRAVLLVLGLCCAIVFSAEASPIGNLKDGQVILAGHRFHVEIADTDATREHGLMDRTHLAADHGMLFIYSQARIRVFWMKDTLIPLDILFFDAQKRLVNVSANTPPCKADPCPTYASSEPARYVLELQAGVAKQLQLQPGARIQLKR